MRPATVTLLVLAACGDNVRVDPDPAIGEPDTFTVSGSVRYEDWPPQDDGSLGGTRLVAARGIGVAIIDDATEATLALGITSDNGSYSLVFEGITGDSIHVLALASSIVPARPIEVVRLDDAIQGFGDATFPTTTTRRDVVITEASGAAQAFNVFDQLVTVMDRIPELYPGAPIIPLKAFWEAGSAEGTYYFDREIYLLGEASDDDGYDDTVIFHEAGHYVEEAYGRTDSPAGNHDGTPTDPRLAWSEGFSTYFAIALRGSPVYMDSNADGGWAYDLDLSLTKAEPGSGIGQRVSEDMVSEILWDLGDAGPIDDDPMAGEHVPVLALQSYLQTAMLRQVGSRGVDLVDALDGWFVRRGLGTCAAVRSIVTTTRLFPYDYEGAAGACP